MCLQLGLLLAATHLPARQLHVYFVGNSLTHSTTLDRVHELFGQREIDLQFGSQISGGVSLIRHLRHREETQMRWFCWESNIQKGDTFVPEVNFWNFPAEQRRFGLVDEALLRRTWDALVLQPYRSPLAHDLEAIPALLAPALAENNVSTLFIYQTWPRRDQPPHTAEQGYAGFDYASVWDRPYTRGPEDTSWQGAQEAASRDYFQQLIQHLRERHRGSLPPIRLIPVGELLYQLDLLIKDDAVPGLRALAERQPDLLPGMGEEGFQPARGVNMLYHDAIHFNPVPHQSGVLGNFLSGTMLMAALSGENPLGLSAAGYGFDDELDAELIRFLQTMIRDILQETTASPAQP